MIKRKLFGIIIALAAMLICSTTVFASIDSEAYVLTSGEEFNTNLRANDYFKFTLPKTAKVNIELKCYEKIGLTLSLFDINEAEYQAAAYSADIGEIHHYGGNIYYTEFNSVTEQTHCQLNYKLPAGTYYFNTNAGTLGYNTDATIKATIIFPPKGDVDMNGSVNALSVYCLSILQEILHQQQALLLC